MSTGHRFCMFQALLMHREVFVPRLMHCMSLEVTDCASFRPAFVVPWVTRKTGLVRVQRPRHTVTGFFP